MVQISVEHVSFSYPDSKVQALKNVSFTIEKGEYIAVLGARLPALWRVFYKLNREQ